MCPLANDWLPQIPKNHKPYGSLPSQSAHCNGKRSFKESTLLHWESQRCKGTGIPCRQSKINIVSFAAALDIEEKKKPVKEQATGNMPRIPKIN